MVNNFESALIRQQVYAWEKMKKGGRERPSGHWLLWLLAPTKAIGSLVGQIYDVYQGHQVSGLMGQDRYDQMMMFDRSCFLLWRIFSNTEKSFQKSFLITR
ncbi:hypothetical protein TNCT_381351 [Trichonephila clavata]|uniref:Uncharacterized protein n=1 Tax=Trichonephila clavata TaxID=2740835 RepID=A0A8X6I1B2_TRICU|nr:hypothetical protein TNCT_381351 [Trichonephila clavata]